MDAGDVARLGAWLAGPAARELTPVAVASLAAAWPGGTPPLVRRRARGTLVAFQDVAGAARRVLELDPSGVALAWLRWDGTGRLLEDAAVRLPDRSWVLVEPRATRDAPWGISDRLWHGRTPVRTADSRALSLLATVDYGAVRTIPPLAEPTRLPPGAGTAVLNLLASLAEDQGTTRVTYAGPYPTEALFLSLQESFHFEGNPPEPRATFLAGDLTWRPAPHERRFGTDRCYVQARERIDKVVWRGRAYYREDWQGVRRHAPRRVRDVPGGTRCSLWALGRPIEDHLELDGAGEVRATFVPAASGPARPMPHPVVVGLVAAVAATSAPALGPFIRAQADTLSLEWGPVEGDLLAVSGARITMSGRLRDAARTRTGATRDGAISRSVAGDAPLATGPEEEPQAVALMLFAELATLVGDELRARAQRSVLALSPAAQARVVETDPPDPAPSSAAEIMAAVAALLADLASD